MQSETEYWSQGTDRIEEYHSMVKSIITLIPEPKRSQVQAMMDGPIGEQFMTSPASTRRAFHYAFPCGLVAHSLNVVKNAWKIADALWPGRWEKWQVAFVALFHDLGKAGSPGKPYYVPEETKWKREKGEYWTVSQEEWTSNSEQGVWTLLRAGVDLSYEEVMSIRLNDGMGPAANKDYSFKEPVLALVIHWADHAAMRSEKEEANI